MATTILTIAISALAGAAGGYLWARHVWQDRLLEMEETRQALRRKRLELHREQFQQSTSRIHRPSESTTGQEAALQEELEQLRLEMVLLKEDHRLERLLWEDEKSRTGTDSSALPDGDIEETEVIILGGDDPDVADANHDGMTAPETRLQDSDDGPPHSIEVGDTVEETAGDEPVGNTEDAVVDEVVDEVEDDGEINDEVADNVAAIDEVADDDFLDEVFGSPLVPGPQPTQSTTEQERPVKKDPAPVPDVFSVPSDIESLFSSDAQGEGDDHVSASVPPAQPEMKHPRQAPEDPEDESAAVQEPVPPASGDTEDMGGPTEVQSDDPVRAEETDPDAAGMDEGIADPVLKDAGAEPDVTRLETDATASDTGTAMSETASAESDTSPEGSDTGTEVSESASAEPDTSAEGSGSNADADEQTPSAPDFAIHWHVDRPGRPARPDHQEGLKVDRDDASAQEQSEPNETSEPDIPVFRSLHDMLVASGVDLPAEEATTRTSTPSPVTDARSNDDLVRSIVGLDGDSYSLLQDLGYASLKRLAQLSPSEMRRLAAVFRIPVDRVEQDWKPTATAHLNMQSAADS